MKKLGIEISDFETLSKLSLEMVNDLVLRFPPSEKEIIRKSISEKEFPIRWTIKHRELMFEWVVSEMGSITLRLGASPEKSQSPIFYLSLGKYEEIGFLWEDPDGTPIKNLDEQLESIVLEKIDLYYNSIINS